MNYPYQLKGPRPMHYYTPTNIKEHPSAQSLNITSPTNSTHSSSRTFMLKAPIQRIEQQCLTPGFIKANREAQQDSFTGNRLAKVFHPKESPKEVKKVMRNSLVREEANEAPKLLVPGRRMPRLSQNSLPNDGSQKNSMIIANERPISNYAADRQEVLAPRFLKNREKTQRIKQSLQADQLNRPDTGKDSINQKLITNSQFIDGINYMPHGQLGEKAFGITINNFHKIRTLGNGKYGQVLLVRQKITGCIYALKVISKKMLQEEQITEQFIRELKIQMYLQHPNIIKMYGHFHDADSIYIVLEVGTGGQLYDQLKASEQMPEAKVAGVMRQLCDAVNYIHSQQIIHRDIKPENIVLHDGILKLCDFGWSVYQDRKLRTTFCGTPLYVCPEILRGHEYNQKIDIWSVGIMMYQMVVGENPFKITKEEELIKIVNDEISIPSYVFVSKEARDFLDKCLRKNPEERAPIRELLNHQFLSKYPDKTDKKLSSV